MDWTPKRSNLNSFQKYSHIKDNTERMASDKNCSDCPFRDPMITSHSSEIDVNLDILSYNSIWSYFTGENINLFHGKSQAYDRLLQLSYLTFSLKKTDFYCLYLITKPLDDRDPEYQEKIKLSISTLVTLLWSLLSEYMDRIDSSLEEIFLSTVITKGISQIERDVQLLIDYKLSPNEDNPIWKKITRSYNLRVSPSLDISEKYWRKTIVRTFQRILTKFGYDRKHYTSLDFKFYKYYSKEPSRIGFSRAIHYSYQKRQNLSLEETNFERQVILDCLYFQFKELTFDWPSLKEILSLSEVYRKKNDNHSYLKDDDYSIINNQAKPINNFLQGIQPPQKYSSIFRSILESSCLYPPCHLIDFDYTNSFVRKVNRWILAESILRNFTWYYLKIISLPNHHLLVKTLTLKELSEIHQSTNICQIVILPTGSPAWETFISNIGDILLSKAVQRLSETDSKFQVNDNQIHFSKRIFENNHAKKTRNLPKMSFDIEKMALREWYQKDKDYALVALANSLGKDGSVDIHSLRSQIQARIITGALSKIF